MKQLRWWRWLVATAISDSTPGSCIATAPAVSRDFNRLQVTGGPAGRDRVGWNLIITRHRVCPQARLMGCREARSNSWRQMGHERNSVHCGAWMGILARFLDSFLFFFFFFFFFFLRLYLFFFVLFLFSNCFFVFGLFLSLSFSLFFRLSFLFLKSWFQFFSFLNIYWNITLLCSGFFLDSFLPSFLPSLFLCLFLSFFLPFFIYLFINNFFSLKKNCS